MCVWGGGGGGRRGGVRIFYVTASPPMAVAKLLLNKKMKEKTLKSRNHSLQPKQHRAITITASVASCAGQ